MMRRGNGAKSPWVRRVVAVAMACAAPAPAFAQILTGRILEEGRDDRPVPEATIALVDREGKRRAQVVADSLGRYRLVPPDAGEYVVEVTRIGYAPTRSPLFAMVEEGTAPLDFLLRPEPIGLEGFEVTVNESSDEVAARLLRPFGLDADLLDERWIDREEIDAIGLTSGVADVILWQGIPGVSVRQELLTPSAVNSEDPTSGAPRLCVTHARGRGSLTFSRPQFRCALVVLNGAVTTPEAGYIINTQDVEAIAVLTPITATTLYGTAAGGGAVLIWTRQNRRRVR